MIEIVKKRIWNENEFCIMKLKKRFTFHGTYFSPIKRQITRIELIGGSKKSSKNGK